MPTEIMNTRAILTFGTDQSGYTTLNLPRASKNITTQNAQSAMQAIIASGAVITANGKPVTPISAKVRTTTRKVLVG